MILQKTFKASLGMSSSEIKSPFGVCSADEGDKVLCFDDNDWVALTKAYIGASQVLCQQENTNSILCLNMKAAGCAEYVFSC
jgi:hypothetical protein